MRKHLSIIAAAAMSVAIAGITDAEQQGVRDQQYQAQDQVHTQDQYQTRDQVRAQDQFQTQEQFQVGMEYVPQHPPGVRVVQDPEGERMLIQVIDLTSELMDKDYEGMVDHFSSLDRDRLAEFEDRDMPQLYATVDQIQEKWRTRYGEGFAIRGRNAEEIFVDAKAIQGEIENPQALVGQWPVNVLPEGTGEPVMATVREPLTEEALEEANLEEGRDLGVVYLSGKFGLPALQLSFIGERLTWKLDLPPDRTGQQIHDDLLTHLTLINEHFDKLPHDQFQAKRLLSHHVLMGIYGISPHGQQPDFNGQQIQLERQQELEVREPGLDREQDMEIRERRLDDQQDLDQQRTLDGEIR
jgi:hypothetical protein